MTTSRRFAAANYTPSHREMPLPYGNMIPNVTHSTSDRPHSDVAAAAWLPLADTDVNRSMGFFVRVQYPAKDYFVITPGKAVAVTRENLGLSYDEGPLGRLVPAGVRICWAAAGNGDTILEYGAVDVSEGIEDLTSGAPVTAAVSYTKAQVTAALIKRALLRPSEGLEAFISKPVGVLPQSALAWCGGDGLQPVGYRKHNYKKQHKSSLLCDWVLRLPYVPSGTLTAVEVPSIATVVASINEIETSAEVPSSSTHAGLGGAAATQDGAWVTGAGGEMLSIGLSKFGVPSHSDYVGLVLGVYRADAAPHLPVKIFSTGGVDKTSSVLVRQVACIDDLSREGDYYISLEPGILFIYESGGNALPTGLAATDYVTISAHSKHETYVSDLASIVGDVRPGDQLVIDGKSNFRPYIARPAETQTGTAGSVDYVDPSTFDRPEDIVGQVLTFKRYPSESMQMVKTFYDNLPTGLADAMPGSATGGYTQNLTYAGGGRFEVIVNLLK